jgi:phosphoribosylformylglycinamidine cyclo-ligase
MPPIFELIRAKGGVPDDELYQVFNMGIGMVLIVSADQAVNVMKSIHAQKQRAWLIGQVAKGRGVVRLV